MIDLYFIRHGMTQWNLEKRLQGRSNIPLNEHGRQQISEYRLPQQLKQLQWFSSPLLRARETAELLSCNAASEADLIEMNWGDWEGCTLAQLRAIDGEGFSRSEAMGFDLLPPNGESPRMVAQRVTGWIESIDSQSTDRQLGCISHKGVIRAIYALASGWDMQDKPPQKLDYHCAQHFRFDQGRWSVAELNIKLAYCNNRGTS
ncbi:MAG: histidine phosphatase family protein [Amphritea sp.]